MSLKFFFNRKGRVVLGMTLLGWVLTLWNLFYSKTVHGPFTRTIFYLYVGLALLVTLIRFIPWYAKKDRGAGIEEHFEKTLVPVAYILVLIGLIYPLWANSWPIILFMSLFFGLIVYASSILIFFHFQDKDPIAPSFFSRNLYLL